MEFLKRIYMWVLAIVAALGYYMFAYHFKRTDHSEIFTVYTALFAAGIIITLFASKLKKAVWIIFGIGLAFRLMFLFVTPHLSDDYFRFTWDGELQKDGISAFEFLPKNHASFFEKDTILAQKYADLYSASTKEFPDGMNSKIYFSIYPTVNQGIFYVSGQLGSPNKGNLVAMRVWIILAEIISFFLLRALLTKQNYSEYLVGFYWLNPLIVIELVGNLHFDGVAITFILMALYLLKVRKTGTAGIALSLAITTKLNPLFFLGAAFNRMSLKQFIGFSFITGTLTFALLLLILDAETFWNFKNSFGLYFAWFGFNSGPHYLIKEIGLMTTGISISDKISILFPLITIVMFAIVSLGSKKHTAHKLLLLYVIYFSFTPVVHPWYLTVLIPLGLLSGKLYPLLWALLAFFTYSAYGSAYGESNTVIFIEFGLVYALMYVEHKKNVPAIENLKARLFKKPISDT